MINDQFYLINSWRFVHILESVSSVWFQLTIVAGWLGIVVLTAEWLYFRQTTDPEIARKIVHIGTGNVILVAWWLQMPAWVGIGAAIVAGTIAIISYKLPILPGINSVGRKSFGTFFYAVSIGVLIAWFWPLEQPYYAAIGILIMTWADGFAAIIGQSFGKHPYQIWGIKKSWEGSLTMFLISYIVTCSILLAIQGVILPTFLVSLVVALAATILEIFSKLGIDNLTVPIASAAICFFLNQSL